MEQFDLLTVEEPRDPIEYYRNRPIRWTAEILDPKPGVRVYPIGESELDDMLEPGETK